MLGAIHAQGCRLTLCLAGLVLLRCGVVTAGQAAPSNSPPPTSGPVAPTVSATPAAPATSNLVVPTGPGPFRAPAPGTPWPTQLAPQATAAAVAAQTQAEVPTGEQELT